MVRFPSVTGRHSFHFARTSPENLLCSYMNLHTYIASCPIRICLESNMTGAVYWVSGTMKKLQNL